MDCLAMEVMPDHIHLLVSCKPQLRLSDAIKVLKGNTARWLFMGHPELKNSLWGGHLWNPSYFVVDVYKRQGVFEVKERAERTGRNPQTKEEILIPASRTPSFKPGKPLKEVMKG